MALIIEAPNEVYSIANNGNQKLFLAGGITGCPDWQSVMIDGLKDVYGLTIYNPRRAFFDPAATEAQITWEFNHLAMADAVVFWFSRGTLNPIVLLEFGLWGLSNNRPIFIGIDKGYEREQDISIQTALARPELQIYDDLDDIICDIAELINYPDA